MHQTSLLSEDLEVILPLVESICARHDGIDDPRLAEAAPGLARQLPAEVQEFLIEYRDDEASAVCVLSDFPVDDSALGPTPARWNEVGPRSSTYRHEVFFLLCATLVGSPSGRAGQQDGRLVQEVLSLNDIRHENPADGTSRAEAALWWHTEDAGDPRRPDHVALMCLRNPDDVATAVCAVEWIDWAGIDLDPLYRPEFPIRTDPGQPADPPGVPVLSGDRARPFLCLDPQRTRREALAPPARAAFGALTRAVDVALNGLVLWPGDIAFIDNRRAVHGWERFEPRHDGTDPWLKRLKLTRRST